MIRDLLKFFYIDIMQTKCLIQILLVLTRAHIARLSKSAHNGRNKLYLNEFQK